MDRKKFKIVTLGCRTNQYESRAYEDQLTKLGMVRSEGAADLCIVNTCTVTEQADKKSYYQLKKLRRENPEARIVATGCLVARESNQIDALGIETVPNHDKERLLELLYPDMENLPEFKIEHFDAKTRAFVKVQDGCNSYCSYCIIPMVRGRSRSRSIVSVVEEVEGLVNQGYKEVVLTGINVGDFEEGLANLVRAVDKVEGLERLRISSIDPDEVDDDLLDAVAFGEKTCHSMHIVLQSGSNSVLKRMRRKYTVQEFMEAWQRLQSASPAFTLTTDVIVGFPGETLDDHAQTKELIEEVGFAKVHLFPYSVRPKTRAARMDGHLEKSEIARRKSELTRVAEKSAYTLRDQYVGKKLSVLIEGDETKKANCLHGYSDNFLPVSVLNGKGVRRNEIVDVEVHENDQEGLYAIAN